MSAGSRAIFEFAFGDIVPMNSLITNCPVIPKNISEAEIESFASAGKELAIISGEKDFALEKQKDLINKLDSAGVKSKFIINQDFGHEFSDKFPKQLDDCLKWILK
jgi:hypothetical protein